MKRWTVISSVVSTLLVASILTFGVSTEIASAHGGDHSEPCIGPHKKDPLCGGGGGGDELMSTFDVVVTIEGLAVDCISATRTDCKSKPIRDDRLDRTTGLVMKGMNMTFPLQGFLAAQFEDDCFTTRFNLDMDGILSVFEPRASPRTIQMGYGFQGLDISGNFQDYSFNMFCTILDAADDWVPTGTTEMPTGVTEIICQEWILTSHGSLDYCEQETGASFRDNTVTGIIVSGPNPVPVD